jgi:hypothetical protein
MRDNTTSSLLDPIQAARAIDACRHGVRLTIATDGMLGADQSDRLIG